MGQLGMNQQIATQISEKIQTGEIPPETKLPSEKSLADELNVSRDVVRRAYAILKNSGFIESQQSSGWHVIQNPKQ